MATFELPPPLPGAACLGSSVDFFPDLDGPNHGLEAKRICAQCPVLAECLEGALERHEEVGIWGGAGGRTRTALGTARHYRAHPEPGPVSGCNCAWCYELTRHIARLDGDGDRLVTFTKGATHGRRITYNKGCRCGRCKFAATNLGQALVRFVADLPAWLEAQLGPSEGKDEHLDAAMLDWLDAAAVGVIEGPIRSLLGLLGSVDPSVAMINTAARVRAGLTRATCGASARAWGDRACIPEGAEGTGDGDRMKDIEYVTSTEVAKRFKTTRQTVVAMIHSGELVGIRVGGKDRGTWRITGESVEAFEARQMAAARGEAA